MILELAGTNVFNVEDKTIRSILKVQTCSEVLKIQNCTNFGRFAASNLQL